MLTSIIASKVKIGYFQYQNKAEMEKAVDAMYQAGIESKSLYSDMVGNGLNQIEKALERLQADDVLIVYKPEDLGSPSRFKRIYNELKDKNVDLQLLKCDRTIEELLNFSEMQAEVGRRRNQHVYAKKRREGKSLSGGMPFGYVSIDSYPHPHPEQWMIARKAIETFLKTKEIRKTLKILKEENGISWAVGNFREWLQIETIRGNRKYPDGEIVYGTHAALTSPDEANQIDQIFADNKKKWTRNPLKKKKDNIYSLKGLVFCECGSSMYRHFSRQGKTEKLRCRRRDEAVDQCPHKTSAFYRNIEEQVIDVVVSKSSEVIEAIQSKEKQNKNLAPLIKQIELLEKAIEYGDNPIVESTIENLRKELERETNKVSHELDSSRQVFQLLSDSKTANKNFWYSMTDSERFDLFHKIVEKVIICNGDIHEVKLKV